MAQVAGVLVLNRIPDRKSKLVLLASIEEAKFRKPVLPGDQLRIEMKVIKVKSTVAKMQGTATVDGAVVAEAIVLCSSGPGTKTGVPCRFIPRLLSIPAPTLPLPQKSALT